MLQNFKEESTDSPLRQKNVTLKLEQVKNFKIKQSPVKHPRVKSPRTIQPFDAIKNLRISALLEKPQPKKYKPIILATKKSPDHRNLKVKEKSPILDKS